MTRSDDPFRAHSRQRQPGRYRGGYRGHHRGYRERERRARAEERRREQLEPKPVNGMCNPLCPFFRCSRGALVIRRMNVKGKMQLVPFCTWVGDVCIGPKCQYAYCARRALLPDGRCLFAARAREKREVEDFEKEIEKELEEERKAAMIARKKLGRGLEEELL